MSESREPRLSNETLRQSSSRVEQAMAELDAARFEQEELLAAADLTDNLIATAIAADALTSKKWGKDPTFTQRLVENMTMMLRAGQPFVIANRESPNAFLFGDTPADPFLIPGHQGDGRNKIAQAEIVYRGNGTSFQIADTRSGSGAFGGYSPDTPPSYFPEPELLRAFFGSKKLAFSGEGSQENVTAQTEEKVLISGTADIGEQYRRLFELEPTNQTLSLIRRNTKTMNRLGSDGLKPSRFVEDLTKVQKGVLVDRFVTFLTYKEKEARKEADREAYYNPSSMLRHEGSGLITSIEDVAKLLPIDDVHERVLGTVGRYSPPERARIRRPSRSR